MFFCTICGGAVMSWSLSLNSQSQTRKHRAGAYSTIETLNLNAISLNKSVLQATHGTRPFCIVHQSAYHLA